MKKEKVGAIVLAVSAGLFLLATSVALVLPRLRRRVQKSELKNILFIGDSQTKPTWSYANKLASKLGVSFQKIAENGKQTEWMREQISKTDLTPYDAIFIFGGGNDISAIKVERAKQNLDAIYNYVKSKGKILVAISPPSKALSTKHNEVQKAQNLSLRDFVLNHPLPDLKIDATSIENKTFFSSDNIHLNNAGQTHLSNIVYSRLKG